MTSDAYFDLVVIGSGPGGYSTALRAAQLGLHVAIVDRNPNPGGTCVHRGCIPTKALIQTTHAISSIKNARQFGIHASIEDIDFGTMHQYIRSMVRETSQGVSQLLQYRGVSMLVGIASVERIAPDITNVSHTSQDARFAVHIKLPQSHAHAHDTAHTTQPLSADQSDEQQTTVTARYVVLALGSSPTPLSIDGNGVPWSASVLHSTGALALTSFPKSVVIIGSGVIATEFASLWAEAGVHVTMIARSNGAMAHTDRHVNAYINQSLRRQGVRIYSSYAVSQLTTGANLGVHVRVEERIPNTAHALSQQPACVELDADYALVAIGRHPNTGAAWVQALGICDGRYHPIHVNGNFQTTVPGLYALGDCIQGPQLAHAAFAQGIAAAEHIAHEHTTGTQVPAAHDMPLFDSIPHVVFSNPEIATIGLQTAQAQQDSRYTDVQEHTYPMLGNARARMLHQGGNITIVSAVRTSKETHADQSTYSPERIVVGIHMVGPQVSEFMAEAQQLVAGAIPLHEAASRIHAHPTLSESLGEALLRADGRPLHVR